MTTIRIRKKDSSFHSEKRRGQNFSFKSSSLFSENKADRHKSRAYTKELTHIKTLHWLTYLQISTFAHMHICKLAHLHTRTSAFLHICILTHLHICILAHLSCCTFAYLHTITFAHLHTWTFAHLHICTHTYLHFCILAHWLVHCVVHLSL